MMLTQQGNMMSKSAQSKSTIVLTIHSAKNLLALHPDHSSNPLIRISVGENQSAATPVQRRTCNPCYNCTFAFEDCQLPTTITIRVLNKVDYVDEEEVMGMASIHVTDVCNEAMTEVPLHCGNNARLARYAPDTYGSVCISYTVEAASRMMQHCRSSTPPADHLPYSYNNRTYEEEENNGVADTISFLPPSAPSLSLTSSAANNVVHCAASPAQTLPWPHVTTGAHQQDKNHHVQIVAEEPFAQLHELVAKSPQPQRNFAHLPKSTSLSSASSACLSETASSSSSSSSADLHQMQRSSVYSEVFVGTESCPPSLIPPRLTPAKAPVNLSYFFPDSAAAPPTVQNLSLNMKHKANRFQQHNLHHHHHHHHHDQQQQQENREKESIVHDECNNVPMFVSYAVSITHPAFSSTFHSDNHTNNINQQNNTINVDEEDEEEKFYAINDLEGRVPVSVSPSTQSSLQLNIETTLPVAGSVPTTNKHYYPQKIHGNKASENYCNNNTNNDGRNPLLHALANTNLVCDAKLVAQSARNSPQGKVTPSLMYVDASQAPSVLLTQSFHLPMSTQEKHIKQQCASEAAFDDQMHGISLCSSHRSTSSEPMSCLPKLQEDIWYEMLMPVVKPPHTLPISLSTSSSRRTTPQSNVLFSEKQNASMAHFPVLSQFPSYPVASGNAATCDGDDAATATANETDAAILAWTNHALGFGEHECSVHDSHRNHNNSN